MSERIMKVLANVAQGLTEEQKLQARTNIGAIGGVKVADSSGTTELVPDEDGKVTVDLTDVGNVPPFSGSDNGLVLGVVGSSDPELQWVSKGGGGTSYTAGDGINIDTNDVISAKVDGTSIGVNASGELESLATVDQHYDASSTNAQSGTAVAEAMSGVSGVPSVGSGDDGKVLTADYTGGSGTFSWQDPPAQEQADWAQTNTSAVDFIKNKPSIPSKTSDLTNDSGFITAADEAIKDVTQNGSSVVNAQGVAEIVTRDVPSSTSSDSGKVLTVDSSGSPVWVTPSGGQSYTAGNGIDITSDVISAKLDGSTLTNGSNGLSVTNPVPDTTGASTGDVLSVGSTGLEWVAPGGGGGSGIDAFLDGIETTPDKKAIGVKYGTTLQFTSYQYTAFTPLTNYSSSNKAYIWNPWRYAHNGGIFVTTYDMPSSGYNPTWYPYSGNHSIYIRQKTASWSYSSGDYYIWDGNSRRKVGSRYYYTTVKIPTGTGTTFDTSIFDVVGDWSGVTTPIEAWYLGFADASGNRTNIGMTSSNTTTEAALRTDDVLEVKTKTNGGIGVDCYNGLYVTNPVPDSSGASTGDVLSVGSSGLEWVTPSGGTTYSAGSGISIANDTISAKVDGSSITVNASGELQAAASSLQTKPLVAGSGITLTASASDVTISADSQLPSWTSSDANKSLTVNASGSALEFAPRLKGILVDGNGSSDCSGLTINTGAGHNAGLVRMRPSGGSNAIVGWLVPDGFSGSGDAGCYPTPTLVDNAPELRWRKDPMDIEQLTKVTRSYGTSTTQELSITAGNWYEVTITNNAVVRIALETTSTDTVHTIIVVKGDSAASTAWANIDYFTEMSTARYIACDLSSTSANVTARVFDVYIKGGFRVESIPRSFCRVRELEPSTFHA